MVDREEGQQWRCGVMESEGQWGGTGWTAVRSHSDCDERQIEGGRGRWWMEVDSLRGEDEDRGQCGREGQDS